MKTYKLAVPSGIGDFSWMWSKFSTIKDAQFEVFVPDSFPQRTKEFCDLLPNCKGKLGQHQYPDIITWGSNRGGKTWEQIVRNFSNGEEVIYIQCNEHVGQGRPIAEWLPDLSIDYHYKINVDFNKKFEWPEDIAKKPKIGITMASMRGIRAWNAWLPETWAEWMRLVHKDFPDVVFVFLGGRWDIDTMAELSGIMNGKIKIYDMVGMTTLPEAFKVLNECNYFIGYSSGLTVVRTVLNKPSCTLWPRHQFELMYSWADPEQINKREYVGFIYDSAERIYMRVKNLIKEALNGA